MSVLIKGMEMPTSCTECPCCRHDNWNGETAHQCNVSFITFGAEDENWIYNTRPNWCPLIELPFAEELAEKLYKQIEKAVIEESGLYHYEEEAIEAWNRRVTE